MLLLSQRGQQDSVADKGDAAHLYSLRSVEAFTFHCLYDDHDVMGGSAAKVRSIFQG